MARLESDWVGIPALPPHHWEPRFLSCSMGDAESSCRVKLEGREVPIVCRAWPQPRLTGLVRAVLGRSWVSSGPAMGVPTGSLGFRGPFSSAECFEALCVFPFSVNPK